MPQRPRLTPAIADVRRAVREALADFTAVENSGELHGGPHISGIRGQYASDSPEFSAAAAAGAAAAGSLVLVALSGGPDSLALAAAAAFEAPRAGAVIVDHGLQDASAEIAERAAGQARALGLDPVRVVRVRVTGAGGPEAAARTARYEALDAAAAELGAVAILLGHTLDDQAETVLLGLARGSGAVSLHGMAPRKGTYLRPLLGIRRTTTVQACADAGLEPWNDPHNDDPAYTRVRVRQRVLPVLETELGPGVAEALARTAEQLREDSEALDHMADEVAEELVELEEAGVSLSVSALAANPAALRQRLIRLVAESEFHVSLSRVQTLWVARLVTDWHGQKAVDLPGFTAERRGNRIHLVSTTAGPLTGVKPPHDH